MAPLVIERVTRQVPPLSIAGKDVRNLVNINRSTPWPAGAAVLVTNVRRHAVYNKSPEELRALNRSKQSISNSVAFDAPIVQIEPVHYDSAHVVVLTTSGEVSLVVLKDLPDGSINAATTVLVKVPGATCVAVVQEQGTAHKPTDPLANKSLAIFGASKAGAPFYAVVESLTTTEAAAKTVEGTPYKQPWAAAFGAPTKAAAGPYGFIAVAGAAGSVVVVRAPALGTPVTPSAVTAHSEGGLGFLAFATAESAALGVDFSEATKAGATTVFVTASGSGHEVRLWGLSATGVTDLLQTFNVTGDTSSRLVLMDPLSELVVLQSREATGTIMVLQLAANRTSIIRVTEWSVDMAPLAGSMAFASAGEVALVGRVEKGLVRIVLDEARLRGAANVDGSDAARPSAARAGALTSGAREIVSNKRGQRTVTLEEARADPAASGAALAEFTAAIHEQLAAAGAEIANLDRQVGDALNALRHPEALKSLKEAARSTAVSALAETAGARPAGAAAAGNGTVALSSSSFAPVLEPEFFGDWLKAISQYTEKVVAKAYRDHVDLNVAVAVDRVWPRVKRSLEREAPAVERITAMDAYRTFEQSVARQETERKELIKRQVNASQTKMANLEETLPAMYSAMDKAASYERLLAAELATLAGAITAAKANISKASAKYAPVEAFDVEAALASLLKSAQAGDFATVASTLASSGNLGLVVRFLEHDDSRADEVVSASHLTVGAFAALARLLAQNLDNAPAGTAPSRVKWLKALALAFDPEFAPAAIVSELRSIKGQLQPVHDMLAIVKGDQRMNREALVARKSFAAMLSA